MKKTMLRRILNKIISYKINNHYKELLKLNNIRNEQAPFETEWLDKWGALGKTSPIYYRLFTQYIGTDINIVPEDICVNYIEPILNPLRYVSYYSDKNMFDKMFKPGTMPQTFLRKINGFYFDANYVHININDDSTFYQYIDNCSSNKIVIKPSTSCSGNNVKLFLKKDNGWYEIGADEKLNLEYINRNYGENFLIQECIEQCDALAKFNLSSVNTLRLTLYRSVKDNQCYIPSAMLRIGKEGAVVDNAHAGGGFVGIKPDGFLCNRVLDQYGHSNRYFNGIDFSQEHKLPNWDKVVEFAKYIGGNVHHHRLLALDIMIDKSGTPRLIEFNCDGYGMWAFQFTVGSAFGDYTDEIIEYCKANKAKAFRLLKL